MYYNKKGKKITREEWAELFQADEDHRTVGRNYRTVEGHKYLISTVWLGLNHCYLGRGILIFETMIFQVDKNKKINFTDLYQERYSTEKEAIKGHEYTVKNIKKLINN